MRADAGRPVGVPSSQTPSLTLGSTLGSTLGLTLGLTLVEVLVAIAVLAVLSTAASGLLIGAARLQAAAATTSARVATLDPYLLAAGARIAALSVCSDPSDAMEDAPTEPVACRIDTRRCRIEAGSIVCDGGAIVRSRIRAQAGGLPGPAVEVWSVAP